jgi:hypothetical protein
MLLLPVWHIAYDLIKSNEIASMRIEGKPVDLWAYLVSAFNLNMMFREAYDEFQIAAVIHSRMPAGLDWDHKRRYLNKQDHYEALISNGLVIGIVGVACGFSWKGYPPAVRSNLDILRAIKGFHLRCQILPGIFVLSSIQYKWAQEIVRAELEQTENRDYAARVWEMQLAAQSGDPRALLHLFVLSDKSTDNEEKAYCFCALSIIARFGVFNAKGSSLRDYASDEMTYLADTYAVDLFSITENNNDFFYNEEKSKQLLEDALTLNPDAVKNYLAKGREGGVLSEQVETFLCPVTEAGKKGYRFNIC